ncbi:MAG: zinc ribbon domain-containing protein [candidate division Zixibacteria bacterium]|nr:zinc ribbon domain-containing protein [candidate division Zixibacteria bacterium]
MPIYEYSCQQCHNSFDELVRGDEEVNCPDCGWDKVIRKMSVFGFISSSQYVGSTGSNCGGCAKQSCSGCSSVSR